MTTRTADPGSTELVECWCCGQRHPDREMVRLGNHPEVAVCLRCAHFLHQRAWDREDALHPSVGSRVRDLLRSGRRVVMERQWHQKSVIGKALRWLGRHLP